MKKNASTNPPLAWPSAFWIQLQRQFTKPNMRDGLLETDYLFRAILKKSSNRVRVVPGGNAYWDAIGPSELAKWRTTMSLWGWGAKKVITWDPELENEFLRASIRLFALHSDGPIPRVMCIGAANRKNWLLQKLEQKQSLPVWARLQLHESTIAQRFEYLKTLGVDERNKLGFDVKEFFFAYSELHWKKKASERIYRWLLRKGTIPLSATTEWMQLWAWEQEPA